MKTTAVIDVKFNNQRNSFVKKVLRNASLKWDERNEAKKLARVERGLYKCTECGDSPLWGPKQIFLDHIQPVVPVDSKNQTWDSYIERLFVKAEGFQILCEIHHSTKTQAENMLRKIKKKSRNMPKKS